jgi:hypothetical protein
MMGFMMVACRVVIASALAAFSVAAQAQQSSTSSDRLMFDPTGMQDVRRPQTQVQSTQQQPPQQITTGQSAPKPQPATAQPVRQTFTPPQQQAAAPAPRRPAPTLASEPADSNRSAERPIPREQTTLGRVSLPQQGSLGYESRTQMQTYDLSDGRRVPGFDNIQRKDSSYFGLSLRLPTAGAPSSSGSSSSFGQSPSFGSSSSFDRHGAN